ncbi:exopolysaccharide biosynthesis polyprenyl glycosylphosphotransferase [Qipengyuania atrilutea]|uniref:Exopolysaccharide biosynthesis polyprenyl glycosylphosphotransferase n=1 Tax=Qipengyuania atrilutea TaxID=2744473 RepID=A0A850H512_9SPHN|nr:exopolysaccharide biosynthesis polyprenyl glycosylphosphotransferase [Actirhodobacter atriluteus]NVD45746.1 exopolysaccharide biosynthesis polyprenyl glycosylphosphotransferase [Actirhodobacter atriluteus]
MDAAQPRGMPAREKRTLLYGLSMLLDALSLVGGYLIASHYRELDSVLDGAHSIIAIALPVFIMFAIAREVQSEESLESRSLGTRRALGALGATALVMLGALFLFDLDDFSRVGFVITFAGAAVLIVVGKLILDLIFSGWMHGVATATILLLDGEQVPEVGIRDVIDLRASDIQLRLDDPATMDVLSRLIEPFDRVIVACPYEKRSDWAMFLRSHDVGGEIILDRDLLHGAVAIGQYAEQDTLILSRGPLSLPNRIQKRAFDIAASAASLIALSPLLVIIAVAIKLESKGPVFFRQIRVGQGNRQFAIYKFRSMRVEQSDTAGNKSTSRDDDRVTKVGKFIRSTSIDELPQLINVLLGHMSVVGPRPHALGSQAGNALFWEVSSQYWLRHALKPGITGLAQVRGFRGSTERIEDLQDRVRADLEYLANWTLSQDIIIILRTLRVLVHKNAY